MLITLHLEKNNIRRVRELMKDLLLAGEVVVPQVIDECSGPRVLTMTFEEGFHATDVNAIEEAGLQRSDVAHLLSKTFCEQMYRHGTIK